MDEPEAPRRYAAFLARFTDEVGKPTGERLLAACRRR
jgi:hypothetical protein